MGYIFGSWFELAGMSSWALLLCAIWRSALRPLIRPFAPIGKMTLTLYIAQSLVFVPVFYHFGFDRWDDWSQATRFGVGVGAVALQMGLTVWWLRCFQYGPIEYVWRALTYLSRDIPFRRKVI